MGASQAAGRKASAAVSAVGTPGQAEPGCRLFCCGRAEGRVDGGGEAGRRGENLGQAAAEVESMRQTQSPLAEEE